MSSVEHVTGQSFTFWLGPVLVTVENITLSITDETDAKYSRGRANGYVRGKVSAEGSIELDEENFALVTAYAATKGSYQDLVDVDIRGVAIAKGTAKTVEAFGCLIMAKDVLNASPNSNDSHMNKLDFKVAGKDFVKINGIPYLRDLVA